MQPLLLSLHFLGLAMGLSVSFANIVLGIVISSTPPAERKAFARFPPAMAMVGHTGLALLWITGPILLFTRYGGFASMPWTFHVKLTAVVLLTILVGVIQSNLKNVVAGDAAAMARVRAMGGAALLLSLVALVFAVLTFN